MFNKNKKPMRKTFFNYFFDHCISSFPKYPIKHTTISKLWSNAVFTLCTNGHKHFKKIEKGKVYLHYQLAL